MWCQYWSSPSCSYEVQSCAGLVHNPGTNTETSTVAREVCVCVCVLLAPVLARPDGLSPSSLSCQGIDLIKEHDGGRHSSGLSEHLAKKQHIWTSHHVYHIRVFRVFGAFFFLINVFIPRCFASPPPRPFKGLQIILKKSFDFLFLG